MGICRSGESAACGLTEEAVRLREDIALVGDGDERFGMDAGRSAVGFSQLLPAQGNLTGLTGYAVAGTLRDALDSLRDLPRAICGFESTFFLDVEVLSVLAHDDQVNGRCSGLRSFHGSHVCVEV